MEYNLIKIEEHKYLLPPELLVKIDHEPIYLLNNYFIAEGYELRIVGGAVRDILLGIMPKDFDLSCDATYEEIFRICLKYNVSCVDIRSPKGIVIVVLNNKNIEITPICHNVPNRNWKLDSELRDFTINSMSLTFSGKLFDFFDGIKHLKNLQVKFLVDPKQSIIVDPLRIFRYFSLCGHIFGKYEKEEYITQEYLTLFATHTFLINKLPREPIWSHIKKIFVSRIASHLISYMNQINIFAFCGLKKFADSDLLEFKIAHNNVYNRDVVNYKNLFKPSCFLSIFYQDLEEILLALKALKISKLETELCLFICRNRKFLSSEKTMEGKFHRCTQLLVGNFHSSRMEVGKMNIIHLMLLEGIPNDFIERLNEFKCPIFPVKYRHLKFSSDFSQKQRVVNELKQMWIENNFMPTKNELINNYLSQLQKGNV